MQKFMPRSRVGTFLYECARSTPLDSKLMFCCNFVKFGCIWDRFATALNSVQNGPNWCNKCKSSCHEVVSELFAKNSPDTHRGTLNSCFVAFRNVWVHLWLFCYYTKLGANGPIWCNWCKSSCHEVSYELVTTNAPDPHHWTLNLCFSVFCNVWVHLGPFC